MALAVLTLAACNQAQDPEMDRKLARAEAAADRAVRAAEAAEKAASAAGANITPTDFAEDEPIVEDADGDGEPDEESDAAKDGEEIENSIDGPATASEPAPAPNAKPGRNGSQAIGPAPDRPAA